MKKYLKSIDWIRVFSCLAVLFYHLNLLNMGYLAVCSFFVISGYLTTKNALEKDNFSFLEFYRNRFLKLYVPVIVIVFLTLFVVSFFPSLVWQNLKPETTSILLGYNNFWQLSANLNYFTKVLSSPFIHFWYVAILLQFDLIFPFFFSFLKKLGEKIHSIIPVIVPFFLAILSFVFFFYQSLRGEEMFSYYHTFTRSFSLLFGVSLGFIHFHYGPILPKWKNVLVKKLIFTSYFLLLLLFFVVPFFSQDFEMLIISFLTCRLIDYGTCFSHEKINGFIKWISAISLEIYLVQYPVIYFSNSLFSSFFFKLFGELLLIFLLAIFFHFLFDFKNQKGSYVRTILICLFLPILCYGGYTYLISKDYTEEIKSFEVELAQKEAMVLKKQEEYQKKKENEEQNYQNTLNDMMKDSENLDEVVQNIPVVGVGDSVMLGAIDSLYEMFPNGYFDAQISRTAWVVNNILVDLKNKNLLSDTVILNLGVNGDCSMECKEEILNTLQGKNVFWINIPNSMNDSLHVNEKLEDLKTTHDNLTIIDWNQASLNHPEYFRADKVHLTKEGMDVYTKLIYDAIYQKYKEKQEEETTKFLEEHEKNQKNKITFYGNDLLLNTYEELSTFYPDANFIISKENSVANIKKELEEKKKEMNYHLVFLFDDQVSFTEKDFLEMEKIMEGYEVTWFSFSFLENEKMKYIDLSSFFTYDDFLFDRIHLNQAGNEKLIQFIQQNISL